MADFRRFIASSEFFLGYEVFIDITIHNSLDNIVNYFYEHLMKTLVDNKFEVLIEYLKKLRLHIHDFTFEDIKDMDPEAPNYICDHC